MCISGIQKGWDNRSLSPIIKQILSSNIKKKLNYASVLNI